MAKLAAIFSCIQNSTTIKKNVPKEKDDLKCVLCELYLSISPIYIVNNLGYVCGRCELYKETIIQSDSVRATAYEKLAESVKFPCNNHKFGCKVSRLFNKIKSHELNCDFVPMYCPAVECNKLLPLKKLGKHIKSKHSNLIINSSTYLKKHKDVWNEFVLRKHYIIVVHTRFTSSEYLLAVSYLRKTGKNNTNIFKLEVCKDDKNFLNEFEIKPYACKYVPVDKMLPVNVKFVNNIINLLGKIQLNEEILSVAGKESDLIHQILKCPVCTELMFPPIFQCKSGHHICVNCKNKSNYCGTCANVWSETRNYGLESLCDKINIKCFNESCSYEGTVLDVENHLQNCEFKPVLCPFMKNYMCFWKGPFHLLKSHIETKHNGKIITNNQLRKWKNNESDVSDFDYFLIFDRNLFKFTRKIEKISDEVSLQCFNVQQLIINNQQELYMYTIEIIDELINECVLKLSALCCTPDCNNQMIDDFIIKIPLNSLYNFIDFNGCYTYRVLITKTN